MYFNSKSEKQPTVACLKDYFDSCLQYVRQKLHST